MGTRYTCPCCGYKTLDEQPPGTDDLCAICFWEDDCVQFHDPDCDGGASRPSLRQAQKNFLEFGACDRDALLHVKPPGDQDEKDPDWKPSL